MPLLLLLLLGLSFLEGAPMMLWESGTTVLDKDTSLSLSLLVIRSDVLLVAVALLPCVVSCGWAVCLLRVWEISFLLLFLRSLPLSLNSYPVGGNDGGEGADEDVECDCWWTRRRASWREDFNRPIVSIMLQSTFSFTSFYLMRYCVSICFPL